MINYSTPAVKGRRLRTEKHIKKKYSQGEGARSHIATTLGQGHRNHTSRCLAIYSSQGLVYTCLHLLRGSADYCTYFPQTKHFTRQCPPKINLADILILIYRVSQKKVILLRRAVVRKLLDK